MKYFLCLFFVLFSSLVFAETYEADIVNNQGKATGSLKVRQASKGVLLEIKVKDLPAGKHGMHFHKTAHCDHKTGFATAKGHIIHDSKPHGFLHPKGPHEGNLPNLIVRKDGTAHVEIYTGLLRLKKGKTPLLDENGSSLIIHTNKDDHKTQPIGGAGKRIACAKIALVD